MTIEAQGVSHIADLSRGDAAQNQQSKVADNGDNKNKVNIPLSDFADMYIRVEKLFEGLPVVIIGGRAINLLCSVEYRHSPDIDVVVGIHTGWLAHYKEKADKYGFEASDTYNREKGAQSIKLIDKKTGVKFDIYHTGMKPISGIPNIDVLKNFEKITLYIDGFKLSGKNPNVECNVIAPSLLGIMKFNTWVELSGNDKNDESKRNKHAFDLINIIRHQFGGDIDQFLDGKKELLRGYICRGVIRKPATPREVQGDAIRSVEEFKLEIVKTYIRVGKENKLRQPNEIVAFAKSELQLDQTLCKKGMLRK